MSSTEKRPSELTTRIRKERGPPESATPSRASRIGVHVSPSSSPIALIPASSAGTTRPTCRGSSTRTPLLAVLPARWIVLDPFRAEGQGGVPELDQTHTFRARLDRVSVSGRRVVPGTRLDDLVALGELTFE